MKLIILDRDGVINEDSEEYIKSPQEWIPIPGSLEAIARLNAANYHVLVATNQSGIARGYFDLETLNAMHRKMNDLLAQLGGRVDGVFICPHGPKEGCDCRKPKIGLFRQIATRMNQSLTGVPVIGDSLRDLQAAQRVGANPYLVLTGKGQGVLASNQLPRGIPVFDDLGALVEAMLENKP